MGRLKQVLLGTITKLKFGECVSSINLSRLDLLSFTVHNQKRNWSSLNISLSISKEAVLIRSKRRWIMSTIDLEENRPGPYPIEVTQVTLHSHWFQCGEFSLFLKT